MTRAALAAAVAIGLALAGVARAQGSAAAGDAPDAGVAERAAEQTFRAALASADIAALERLGAATPSTRWTDDAWAEAARIAIRANDFARARRDLERVIAVGTDARLVQRARSELARLSALSGAAGEWNDVARVHEELVPTLHAGGDPRPALRRLEALARENPRYPRATVLMIALASGWEREGEPERAVHWLREARSAATTSLDRQRAHADLVRVLTRAGELTAAERELAALAPSVSPMLAATLQHGLDRAATRRAIRWGMRGVLVLVLAAALALLRRAAGSWRAALRRLVRPPGEALFLIPIVSILLVVAYTGNPLVARAVRTIAIAGLVASWLSGALLDGTRGALRLRRALGVAALALIGVGAATYLAVDNGQLLTFIVETWQAGHEVG